MLRVGLDTDYTGDRRAATPRFTSAPGVGAGWDLNPRYADLGQLPCTNYAIRPRAIALLAPLISVSFHAAAATDQYVDPHHFASGGKA